MNVVEKRLSCDHSEKYLVSLADGHTVETLYMVDEARRLTFNSTVCISSQVGCHMGCRFCATGRQGFIRNLTAQEIVGQVELCNRTRKNAKKTSLEAVVFAGMGEPLRNYGQVKAAIWELRSRWGLRQFELATVGIVPQIYEMLEDFQGSDISIRLNLSLHASTDVQRRQIIPMTQEYGVGEIIQAAAAYAAAFNTKARIRYMLFHGFNNTEGDAARLTTLLQGKPLKLILSQYNENNIEGLIPANRLEVLDFYNTMKTAVEAEIFHNFGSDIQGGCGQLKQTAAV